MKSQHALDPKHTDAPNTPVFVEAEKLIEQVQKFTQTVAKRAYEFFESRGREIGHELDDWFRAESEILRPVPMELKEDENQFTIRAEVPGFKAGEINISAEPQRIIFKGASEQTSEEQEEKTVFTERRSNQFYRVIDLSAEIDPTKVTASLKDGVLAMKLPKAPAKQSVGVEIKTT